MATKEYYEICKKHDLVAECFTNEHFPDGDEEVAIYNLPTDQQSEGCSVDTVHVLILYRRVCQILLLIGQVV